MWHPISSRGMWRAAGESLPPELERLRLMIQSDFRMVLQDELRRIRLGEEVARFSSTGVESMASLAPFARQHSADDRRSRFEEREGSELSKLLRESSDDDSEEECRPRAVDGGSYALVGSPTRDAGVKKWKPVSKKIKESRGKYDASDENVRLIQHIQGSLPAEIPCVASCLDCCGRLLQLEEPRRQGCLPGLEASKCFHTFFTMVILFNAVFMVFQVNYAIEHPLSAPLAQHVLIDHVFLCLYTFELVVKLCVHRLFFFWSADMGWNILDFCLVCYSFVDAVLSAIGEENSRNQPTWMRSLRVFRVAKVLRILRVVRAFKQLQLILNCLLGSMMSMLWSVLMIFIMYYMFSLALVQQVRIYLGDLGHDGDDLDRMHNYFGSVERCMWTLFLTTFEADDWVKFWDEVHKLGSLAIFVWVLFIVCTKIAVLNILTSIYVESALELAEGSAHEKAIKHERHMMEDAAELRRLCEQWDRDKSSGLSREEFSEMVRSEEFSRYLHFIGLDMTHIHMFFDLIGERGRKDVEISSFVAGCMHLRGAAKSSDLVALMLEVKKMKRYQDHSNRKLLGHLHRLGDSLSVSNSPSRGQCPGANAQAESTQEQEAP